MNEAVIDDILAVLPPLLESLDALAYVARHLHPPMFGRVMQAIATPDDVLRSVRPRLDGWSPQFEQVGTALKAASDAALTAFAGLRQVEQGDGDLVAVFRALRHSARAQEALYPLAEKFPPVSDFFLDPSLHEDADLKSRFDQLAAKGSGVFHHDNEPGSRGGFSLYVPEYYTDDRAWPLVMALHGGSGHGRSFLWSWLRDARSFGAILVAPTATGSTWALMGDDADTPNLVRILDELRGRYAIDEQRLLLTGMSDGGTFSYVSGLAATSPFTHLAPVAATFHPLMAQTADTERLRELPVFIGHGRLDWMFPVQVARQTRELLSAAGAHVTYRELDDLSHCYPREMNAEILKWLRGNQSPSREP
jgi:phospholipase/carboxylesterase